MSFQILVDTLNENGKCGECNNPQMSYLNRGYGGESGTYVCAHLQTVSKPSIYGHNQWFNACVPKNMCDKFTLILDD